MEQPKAYQLNVENIKSLSDVKVILKGLDLITYSNVKDFEVLKKYFTIEIEQNENTSEESNAS